MTAGLRLSSSSTNSYSGAIIGSSINNIIINSNISNSGRSKHDDEGLSRQVEVMMTEATEDNEPYTQQQQRQQQQQPQSHKARIEKAPGVVAMNAAGQETERWDDAFEFDAHQSLDQIFELLHRHCPQSPLSDSSDQSDYFQARPTPLPLPPSLPTVPSATLPLPLACPSFPLPQPFSTATTTITSLLPPPFPSPRLAAITSHRALGKLHKKDHPSHQKTKRLHGSTRSCEQEKVDPQSCSPSPIKHTTTFTNNAEVPPKDIGLSLSSFQKRYEGQSLYCGSKTAPTTPAAEATKVSSLSPASSASSSPRAITASVTAPSTIATSTGSLLSKYKSADGGNGQHGPGGDKDSPTFSTKSMTTITQEMMLSNLPAYTGIITRINPIKRVKAWVDDLEDLEVPEEDLNFNHVRSILAKSESMPETLESIDSWDTDSERSLTNSDRVDPAAAVTAECQSASPIPKSGMPHLLRYQSAGVSSPSEGGVKNRHNVDTAIAGQHGESEKIETLDDAFEIPDDFGSFRLRMSPRLQNLSGPQETVSYRQQLSLLQWRDSGSDFGDFDIRTPLDSHSLSSSESVSRESVADDDDNLLDGIEFPEAMEDLRLVTHRQYKIEMEPSIFGKDSRLHEDQDDFWDGLEVDDDDAFNHKGRNKNLVVRPVIAGRERSSSRVQREIVPLKDFVALPSRIPRLCRGPTDTSRPVTPAASLSRAHSTHIELPLRHVSSKSSLPRLKRNSITRKEGARIGSALPMAGQNMLYNESIHVSTAPIPPSTSALSSSRRNSALVNKDDLSNFRANSLAMRSVSFTEPSQTMDLTTATPTTLPTTSEEITIASKPPVPTNTGRPFSSLRTLVRKLDLTRPRFSMRGQIPAFDATGAFPPESPVAQDPMAPVLKPIEQTAPLTDDLNEYPHQHQLYLPPRPSLSRSSSFTDWGSVITSTETTKESRSPSRIGAISLGEISAGGSTTSDLGEMAATSPVAAGEKISRRWFLKRSPKQSMLSDGSELDRIDNLPTFGSAEQQQQQQQLQKQQLLDRDRLQAMQMAAADAAAQGRRQSLDRVSAWLRKPQSMVNLKESPKPEVHRAESDVSTTKIQKTKSIRRSLFDIFVPTTAPVEEPKKVEPVEKQKDPGTKGQKLKKKKPFSGPTLIRDLSQTKVRKVSGMVFHPDSKMWNGNDHILNEFDDDDKNDADDVKQQEQQRPPATSNAAVCDSPSPPYSPCFPLAAYSPIAIIRPALISNMNQYSQQRTQVAGKMIFDPNRMCWIINPEYLTRKRQKKHSEQHHYHTRQPSLDDTWGDEPDVFAGMSDSDAEYDKDEDEKETEQSDGGGVPSATTTTAAALAGVTAPSVSANSSLERSKGRRLISRPSFRRVPSQDYLADEERLQAWAEPMRQLPVDAAGNGTAGADSRPQSMGVHSIVSKSSRRSLNMMGGCSNGLFAGGGYSSRGEFEVGVEFDITDDFLEQCMATESQHRKDAGKFFALPCSPVQPLRSVSRDRVPRRMPSKVLNKLKRSSHSNGHGSKDKEKEKDKDKDSRKRGKEEVSAEIPPTSLDNKREANLSPSAPLPLLSWPRRTKSKSVVLQAPILDCIGLPPPPVAQRAAILKPLVLPTEKRPHTNIPNKFKSLTLGRAGLFSHTTASTPAPASISPSRMHPGSKGKETVPSTDSQSTTVPPQSRKSSRDMFFSQRLTSKKPHTPVASDRGTLTFAATFAIARKGASTAYDRRRISAHTFHPLTGTSPIIDGGGGSGRGSGSVSKSDELGFRKDRQLVSDIDSGIDSDEAPEDEDDCERGYRKMPNSRGRPPRRTRSELIMVFTQHSGPGYRF